MVSGVQHISQFRVAGHLVISEQLAGCRSYSHSDQSFFKIHGRMGPVVLISSSIGESEGSNNLNKHSASRFHLFMMFIVSPVSQVSVAIHRLGLV